MSADSVQPLLRSPPFPGVPVAVAAVSALPDGIALPPLDDRDVEEVLQAVRVAAVGGAFWAVPADARADTIVRIGRGDDRKRLAHDVAPSALWLDSRADHVPARRWPVPRVRAVDPWSLLRPGVSLIAHGDDEWSAIAVLVGADLRLLSPGRFGQPGEDDSALRRRVAAHLLACRYRDPFTEQACSLEQTLALLALWHDVIAANRGIVAAAGMAWWKRAEIRHFLWAPQTAPMRFFGPSKAIRYAARHRGKVAIWPSRVDNAMIDAAARRGVPLVRVEDGFVRSVGLGANLVPPLSITADRIGIHYDPSGSSELEALLQDGDFPRDLIRRAAALRVRIVADRISKYGGAEDTAVPLRQSGRRLVLVPGQVEDDRSVLLGGGAVAGNLDLLRRARLAEPDAEIWFRPHPDVDAGHRRGGLSDADALQHVDRVVRGGSMATLLGQVDALHVLTSLSGFEALLRGRDVTCHGVPFFAGWGLTRDLATTPDRRRRRLSLDELVAATLVLYPRYLDPVTRLPCPAETLMARIAERPGTKPSMIVRLRQLQGRMLRHR